MSEDKHKAPAEGDAGAEAPSNPYAHSKNHASVWQAGFDAGRQSAKQVPIEITGSEWEICEAAINESRERYTLNTSRAAFQAGALFACRAALAQPNVQPKGTPAEHLPTKEHIRELAQEALDQIMEQAQVFASAWSLVGGKFDSGNAMSDAEDAKAELRTMVRSLADLAAETVRPAQAPAPAPETDDKQKSTAYERDLELLIHDFVRCSLVGTPSEATLHQLDRLIELVTHPIINRNLKSMRRQVTNPLPPCPPFASRRPSGAEIEAHEVQAAPQPEAQPVAGWVILRKDGTVAVFKARLANFFGSVVENEPLTAAEVAYMDRQWPGLAPHHIVALHAAPTA